MSDRAARLLNSLKLHARTPDGWLYRHPSSAARRAEEDKAKAERGRDLRAAFPLADGRSIDVLTSICSLMSVPAGTALILEGEQPEAVYIVMTGQFGAYHGPGNGRAILDRFGAGDVIGDVGFFTGEAHTVGVRALRNSEVLRISKADLHAAAARCHGVLLAVCSGAVQRLQACKRRRRRCPNVIHSALCRPTPRSI